MRCGTLAAGLSLLVLIVIAGCASPHNGAPAGPQGQNPAPGNNPVNTPSADFWTSTTGCNPPPDNPPRLQKFLPVIAGWTRKGYMYYSSDNYCMVNVAFRDMGPCAPRSADDVLNLYLLNTRTEGKITTTVTKINNFHGYPAVHSVTFRNESGHLDRGNEFVVMGINNRLYVEISIFTATYDADAVFETFAGAIDYQGLAAAV